LSTKILASGSRKGGGEQVDQHLRITSGQSARDGGQIGQFGQAFDHRVAGDDLFDQCRSRSRHADDEDGIARCVTAPDALGEEGRSKGGDAARDEVVVGLAVVGGGRAARGVARGIISEAARSAACVVVGLAEREIQPRAVGGVGVRQQRRHRRPLGGAEPPRLEVGKAPIDFGEPRRER
jgi:hypothetical protein